MSSCAKEKHCKPVFRRGEVSAPRAIPALRYSSRVAMDEGKKSAP